MRASRPSPDLALGIDLGGSKILAGVVDGKNRILGRGKLRTPFHGNVRELADALVAASDLALKEAGVRRERCRPSPSRHPGPSDTGRGSSSSAPTSP